MNDLNLSTQSL